MIVETLRNLLHRRPFQPFRLVMSCGERFEVAQPEQAFLTQSDIVVGADVADDGIPDAFRICSLLHVTAIEPLESASAT